MSVRPAALDLQRERVEQSSAPPAFSTPPQLARNDANAPSQARKRTAHKPRRAVVRRRGARVDSESEQDDLDPQRANVKSRDSDSDSDDLELPSSDDEDSEEDDDGVAEPKTPATASVEQLPQSLDTATTPPRQPAKSRKAVLAGQVLHPSWSDMPAPGEDGDTSLPTLDFSNLSLDVVQHLPSPPPRSRPLPVASTSKVAALSSAPVSQPQASTAASAVQPGGLSKKQLQEQKRQAKLAVLKQKDPEAAERIEKEHQERAAAKRLAKKERLKEKKRERKALEQATKDASAQHAPPQLEQDAAVPAAPPSASNDKPARPAKSARPVVPSRPSRTAVALGLLGPESPPPAAASSERPAPALPPSASATTPIVPAATRQPAFLPRDSEGRPIVQSLPPTRPRAHHQTDDDHAASQWVRGRGGAPRGFGSYRGGRGAARFAQQQDRDEVSAHPDAAEEDRGFHGRGRGRGRGALARGGGFAGRGGRGVVATGPPGSINPRYAHLPFHPLHRFPSPSPAAPKSASPAPSNRSIDQASNFGPEVTTASPDERLFETEAETSAATQEKPTGVVKLPANGAAQIMMTVKGAAAAQAARDHGASKENRPPPAETADAAAANGAEPHKLSDPGILYASAPRRPTEQEAADSSVATSSEAPREPLSLLHQVPPHLQASAGPPVVEQDTPVYYQQQQPYSGPYWSSEAPEPYPISTPSPAPASDQQQFSVPLAHPAPSSAYFVPPRPNKRVEIKNPSSRDGQSPAPLTATKSAPPAPVDALEAAREIRDAQILQQQEHQRQAEASYMYAMNYGFQQQQQQQQQAPAPPTRPPFPSSPTFTRDGFPIAANAPLPPPSVDHQQAVLQPVHAPQMYNPYPPTHAMAQPPPPPTTTTYELVAPYPSHYPAAAAYYAPQQQPMYQPTLSPPVGLPAGYYGGMYGARPVVFEEQQPQWTGY